MTETASKIERAANDNIPTLLTIRQFADKHKFITENSIRWLIFKGDPTFEECVIRHCRRIFLDEKKFFSYLRDKNDKTSQGV